MCKQCSEQGRFDKCAPCRALLAEQVRADEHRATAFPFRREGVVWGAFLRFCFERYAKNFGLLTLTMVVCFGAFFVLNALSTLLMLVGSDSMADLWLGMYVLQPLLMSVLILGVLRISLQVARGQPADLSLLWTGLPRWGAFLLVSGAIGAALFGVELVLLAVFGLGFSSLDANDWTLGTLLLAGASAVVALAVSTYVSLGLVLASIEIVAQPELSVRAALKNAWRIAHGERLTLGFGLFLISLLMFAGTIMCGIGLLFTLGYAAVIFAALYLALRNGAPLATSSASTGQHVSRPGADG